jgi:hypothetical protein
MRSVVEMVENPANKTFTSMVVLTLDSGKADDQVSSTVQSLWN